jgi:hypothetical protein
MADRREQRDITRAKANEMWESFTKDEQITVRFGMFPADKMREAEAAGFDGHELVCALMDCATADGGMRA